MGDVIVEAPGGMDGPDIVAAPSSPLSMDVVPVMIHQLGISIPFGAKRQGTQAVKVE